VGFFFSDTKGLEVVAGAARRDVVTAFLATTTVRDAAEGGLKASVVRLLLVKHPKSKRRSSKAAETFMIIVLQKAQRRESNVVMFAVSLSAIHRAASYCGVPGVESAFGSQM
jgi:hypothetical protein